jgi:hypothetical protein
MVHQGISRRVLRGTTYDPGHWTFYFCRRGFGLVVFSVVVPLMLAVLPYARGRGFDTRSRFSYYRYINRIHVHVCELYLFIVWTNLCFSSFISLCKLYKQLVFDHTLMRKGSVGLSCRAMGSKILSCGMVHQGISRRIEGRYVRPWSLNLIRMWKGCGLVVPLMLTVLPYARGRGFDSRSRLLFSVWTTDLFSVAFIFVWWFVLKQWEVFSDVLEYFCLTYNCACLGRSDGSLFFLIPGPCQWQFKWTTWEI